MTKILKKIVALCILFAIHSCGVDDDFSISENSSENFLDNITTDTTLDPNIEYILNRSVLVTNGAKLTIPAGTKIRANSNGVGVYIAVEQGSKIYVNGTAESPVVMSSTNGEPGDWGGLVLCGKGITTAGENVGAEIGDLIYGGNNPSDSSGRISYLVLKGTGAAINSDAEFNGISFYAVGSGTQVDNIAIINGKDDGVEFFGGNVEAMNVYLQNCGDDSVDWTEGWYGGITNTYVLNNNEGFSTAVEADGEDLQPTLNNFTAISSVGGIALQFKANSGAKFNNVYIEGYDNLIDLKDHKNDESENVWGYNSIFLDDMSLSTNPSDADFQNGTPVPAYEWTWTDASL